MKNLLRSLRGALTACGGLVVASGLASAETRHFTPNHNFSNAGVYSPGKSGFNLADVNSIAQLRGLPPGVKGLVWIGKCDGADEQFIATVSPYLSEPNLYGFYLMDDPDPRIGLHRCRPESLRAEADWVHQHAPGAITFIVLMNMKSAYAPSFRDTYNPENSHIDLFGIDPYPCRTEANGCDFSMIEKYVEAAEAWGIPRSKMVPVFQAFGGGEWSDGNGGKYVMPSPPQLEEILRRWRALIPSPAFDYAYSWGSQRGAAALEDDPALREIFSRHNRE